MYGWIKKFADGTIERGTDFDIIRKRASWKRGRLEGMIGAELHAGNTSMIIEAPGEYWQSDDYDVKFLAGTPSLVIRRLQKRMIAGEMLVVQYEKDCLRVIRMDKDTRLTHDMIVGEALIRGRWLTLEYDVRTREFRHYLKERKI